MMKLYLLFFFSLVSMLSEVNAESQGDAPNTFFNKHAEGWHWYAPLCGSDQNPKLPKTELPKADRKQKETSLNPTKVIEKQKREVEKKLHAAIVEPTRENIIAYILAQKMIMDQSQRFSESWQRVVMTTPSLDETLIHPVDQNARHVYYTQKNKDLTKKIQALSQEYGLFFFFKGACPYCHHFAPIVKHFAKKHGWEVLAVSLDGGSLPEFPSPRQDNGITARLQIMHVPALIALHPQSGQTLPLAYGFVSESEIERRVELLTQLPKTLGEKK